MPSRIIYRVRKIFLVICKYVRKSIRKWLPSGGKGDGISIAELNVTLPEAEESIKLFYGKIPTRLKASAFFILLFEYGHLFHWRFRLTAKDGCSCNRRLTAA